MCIHSLKSHLNFFFLSSLLFHEWICPGGTLEISDLAGHVGTSFSSQTALHGIRSHYASLPVELACWRWFMASSVDCYVPPGGRNSSLVVVGLAVHSVAGSILLWGNFPVEGIFPLELTWVQTPFPHSFG